MSEEMAGLENLDDRETILETRARELAREGQDSEDKGYRLKIVEFSLGEESYAFELTHVREILSVRDVTRIPCSPPIVSGVINIRGQILSIINLKVMFDLPDNAVSDLKQVIILHSNQMEFGVMADAIRGVRAIPVSDIQDSLPTLVDIRAQYLKGVTGDRVTILDGEKLLGDSSLVVNEEF